MKSQQQLTKSLGPGEIWHYEWDFLFSINYKSFVECFFWAFCSSTKNNVLLQILIVWKLVERKYLPLCTWEISKEDIFSFLLPQMEGEVKYIIPNCSGKLLDVLSRATFVTRRGLNYILNVAVHAKTTNDHYFTQWSSYARNPHPGQLLLSVTNNFNWPVCELGEEM